MKRVSIFEPEFVVSVPEPLVEGKLYVSMEFATVIHLCACGCGNKMVTPLKSAGWELRYNGESITLFPSVGCWSFPCRSHYWIRQNRVVWSGDLTDDKIREGREVTKLLHLERHQPVKKSAEKGQTPAASPRYKSEVVHRQVDDSKFRRFLKWLRIGR